MTGKLSLQNLDSLTEIKTSPFLLDQLGDGDLHHEKDTN
jgi:hypothetical protein